MRRRTRLPVLAANWKMNIGPKAAADFMAAFLSGYPPRDDRRIIFFPPAVSIAVVADAARSRRDIKVGAQNIHWEESGAFTGEVSGSLVSEAGAEFLLVGHSERRARFKEEDDQFRRKCRIAFRTRMSPVFCVGESEYQRSEGRTADVVGRQLRAVISHLDAAEAASMMIAYEPIWAIGTGRTATPDDASEVHHYLRFLLREIVGAEAAEAMHILYGGSVKPDNAAALLAAADVDGLLVGGASMNVDEWLRIVSA